MIKRIACWLVVILGNLFFACTEDKEETVFPFDVVIENLSGATACLPTEKIQLRADVNVKIPISYEWKVNGEVVDTDSLYSFSSIEYGTFLIVLNAEHEGMVATDTLSLIVTKDTTFTINHIRNWTGTGDCRSVLAIQWVIGENMDQPMDHEVIFLAWGYRWHYAAGATGADMLRAIVRKDPRLYVILAEQWGGILVKGWGYDANNDGHFAIRNATLSLTEADFTDGIYWQKMTDDIDGLKSDDSLDYWNGGWRETYSSYWIGFGEKAPNVDACEYANYVPSLRFLKNNDWDIYTFSTINDAERNVPPIPRLLKAAP